MNENKVEFRKKLMAIALPVALQNLMLALVGASDALMLPVIIPVSALEALLPKASNAADAA